MNRKLLSVLLVFVLALPLPAVAGKKEDKKDIEKIGERDVGKGMNWYSLEKEIAIGKSLAQQVESQSRIVNDPVVAEYVNRVGQNLVRNSDAKVPFTIKVIDAEEINAFALPGGFFFVNSGLILEAEEEAELAGVMAHEIAHVAARHGTRQAHPRAAGQSSHHPIDLRWRRHRVRSTRGGQPSGPAGFPEVLAQLRARGGFSGAAVHVQDRLRSPGVCHLLREDSGQGEEAPWPSGKGLPLPSPDAGIELSARSSRWVGCRTAKSTW